MFRFKLPGDLKKKKLILLVLVIICIGLLVKLSIDNKKANISNENKNIETKLERR